MVAVIITGGKYMRKFGTWLFDTLCGIFMCEGLAVVLWLILYLIGKKPEINVVNLTFLTEVVILFWVSGFIFHFSSPVLAKGILHSIICFMLSIIIFSVNFGYVPTAIQLIIVMAIFFAVYAAALFGTVALSRKLNVPLRHFSLWLYKLNSKKTTKVQDEK